MSLSPKEAELLRRAIALAAIARESGNPPFGSLVADGDLNLLHEEVNTTLTEGDITAHPELKIARWVGENFTREEAAALTMYTSCEPCSMCAGAIARSGIGRVAYALSGDQLGEIKPAEAPSPLFPWTADGPHMRDEAVAPVVGYY